jgi:hypothetical protein
MKLKPRRILSLSPVVSNDVPMHFAPSPPKIESREPPKFVYTTYTDEDLKNLESGLPVEFVEGSVWPPSSTDCRDQETDSGGKSGSGKSAKT